MFNLGHFAGWGYLVGFDTAEHRITDDEILLVSIPKMTKFSKDDNPVEDRP